MFVLTYWRTRASPRSRTRIGFCSRTDRIDRPRKTCNQNERVARWKGRSKPVEDMFLSSTVCHLEIRAASRSIEISPRYPHLLRSRTARIQLRGNDRTGSAIIARLSTNTFGNLARDIRSFARKKIFFEDLVASIHSSISRSCL